MVPSLPQVRNALAPRYPHYVKANIHQTRPSSFTASWSSSDVYVPILGPSCYWTQISIANMTSLQLHCPICNKIAMPCVFCNLFIGFRINFFRYLRYKSSSIELGNTGQHSLPTCINELWLPMILFTVHQFSFSRTTLGRVRVL